MRKKSVNKATVKLEQETTQMEEKIVGLKQMLQTMRLKDGERNLKSAGGSRWQSASTTKPLKNFATHTLKEQKRIFPIKKLESRSMSQSGKVGLPTKPNDTTSVKSNSSALSTFLQHQGPSDGAAININRALHIQSQQSNEVVKYLQKLNLESYAPVLLENGFDEIEVLKEIQIEHIQQMQIPPKEGRKLINSLTKLNQSQQQQQQIPKMEQSMKSTKSIKSTRSTKQVQSQSQFDGEFNEEESHKYFMEALLQFRNQKPTEEPKQQQSKKVTFKTDAQIQIQEDNEEGEQLGYISSRQIKKQEEQKQKMKFLLGGGNDWVMFDMPTTNNVQTDNQRQVITNKVACNQCYTLTPEDRAVKIDNKYYCTQECGQQYKSQNMYLCKAITCQKQINIEQAFYEYGRWFCNENCYKQFQWEASNIDSNVQVSL